MKAVDHILVRISNPKGSGGGILYFPNEDPDFVYVITARHCLVDKKTNVVFQNEMLSVDFLSPNQNFSYKLSSTDLLIYGKANSTEDIGIIIFPKISLPEWHQIQEDIPLAYYPRKKPPVEITGIPKAVSNKFKRTLYQLTPLEDQDYQDQIQIEVADPISNHYNSDSLVEGYSGSPIVVVSNGQTFIVGIFLAYEENTKRILGINLNLINKLLVSAGKPTVQIYEIEVDNSIFNDKAKLKLNSDRILSRIRMTVGTISLDRADIVEKAKIQLLKKGLTIVTGKPGSGKSAVVKKALLELGNEFEVIALQGEQLDRSSIDEMFRGEPFVLSNSIQTIFDSPASQKHKILLIDSIEKILETQNANTILDFFDLLVKRDDVSLVLTCRNYAVEQLKLRFLRSFPAYPDFEIPLLSEKEISEVIAFYPNLTVLATKPSLAKVLEIPFNLDKATMIAGEVLDVDVNSETRFRELMWEYVIEGREKINDANTRKHRGETFLEIALKRASAMTPYTQLENADQMIIESLISDNIIDAEPVHKRSYTASHDIYEDWAITRYIESTYQATSWSNHSAFFEKLGSSAAIRRAFRIWVSELIQLGDESLGKLLSSTLKEPVIPNHWKDEIIIAVMQSPYSDQFLYENKALLFSNEFKYFKRVVFLLKVACQKPDFSYLDKLDDDQKLQLYHDINLVPFGEGWSSFLKFAHQNLDALKEQLGLIFSMVITWSKGIKPFAKVPPEGRCAGLIILHFYDHYLNHEGFRDGKHQFGKKIDEGILILFSLTEVIKDDLKLFLETVISRKKNQEDYRIRDLYDKVINNILDGNESAIICKNFPDLVIGLAEKKWLYYPPTEREMEEMMRDTPFKSFPGTGIKQESHFGLQEYTGLSYFPASPDQTPMFNLFFFAPYKALEFFLKLINHSGNAFMDSNFGQETFSFFSADVRSEIIITMPDGKIYKQYASQILWMAYRSTVTVTPDLLQSILMALEHYLLIIGKDIEAGLKDKYSEFCQIVFDDFFTAILTKCNNVMATAVLLSVAHAHRNLAGKHILPLLKIKQIYYWDLFRRSKEGRSLSPAGFRKNPYQRQRELARFQKLEHRNRDITELVINLSLGPLSNEIFAILDTFLAENPSDDDWRFLLSKMDRRKFKIIEEVDNGYIVAPELSEDLQQKVEEEQRLEEEIHPILTAGSWSRKKFEKETVENDNYFQWSQYYPTIKDSANKDNVDKLFKQVTVFAAIGIRDYISEMNDEQIRWCFDEVTSAVNYQLFDKKRFEMDYFPYTSSEIEAAFYALPIMCTHAKNNEKSELRQKVLIALLFLEDKLSRDKLIRSINEKLWVAEPEFALCCVESMVNYCQISHLRYILSNQHRSDSSRLNRASLIKKVRILFYKVFGKFSKKTNSGGENQADYIWYQEKEYNHHWNLLIKTVSRGVPVGIQKLTFEKGGTWHLFEALRIIPPDTTFPQLKSLYTSVIDFILGYINKERESYNDKLHYERQQLFHRKFAKFLLGQPTSIAVKFLDEITSWAFEPGLELQFRDKRYEFVEKCLDEVIVKVIRNEDLSSKFWPLWEHLAQKSIETRTLYFDSQLLLDNIFFDSKARDWVPLHGKANFFAKLINANADLNVSIKLISTIGFNELMPDAIEWIALRIDEHDTEEENPLYYFEKIIIQAYYAGETRKKILASLKLKDFFIKILDALINRNASSSAYIIREDFISQNNR